MAALVTTCDRLIQNGYSPSRVFKLTNLPMEIVIQRFLMQPARAAQWNITPKKEKV